MKILSTSPLKLKLRLSLLVKTNQPKRIIEILSWIGSERSSSAVEKVMYKHKNYDILTRAVTFL